MKARWPVHLLAGVSVILVIAAGTLFAQMHSSQGEVPAVTLPIQDVAVQEIPPFTRREIIGGINKEREALKLKPLKESSMLNQSAQLKANDLQARNYWAHTSPDGTEPWSYMDDVGYLYKSAAENLGKCYPSPKAMLEAWRASESHHATMLGDYEDIGLGMRIHTLDCIIVVNHFGKK